METKGLLTSKTIWGAIIAIAATALKIAGYDIGGDTEGFVNDIIALIGAGIAIYGRVRAVKKIEGVK
ncbi:MAG TPA: hypothetical protein DDW17_02150 [Deltaproteobacteria bacterium]|nr:hypothetical protein [Deltaproteobacteria bacterium]